MKTIELIEKLKGLPLFTINDLSRIIGKKDSYVKVVAYRLRKKGLIKHIEKGKYTVYDDPVEFASYITTPSYISFWTALRIYNLTEQLPLGAMVAVPKPKKEIKFNKETITFTKTSQFWGYKKMRYRDFDIFIAEKEKAVIDCLVSKNTPFDEAAKAILSKELDYEKLVEYAEKAGIKSLAKRVGFLTEKAGFDATLLLRLSGSSYIPLNWAFKKKGQKDFRWKIIINEDLGQV
ncbi:MAG: hypothetical protein HZB67_05060 [Candidatus Aenigmarchaeota archaeon]|nr:hypothetical protein [Candidatus Aenigmarchaeota archaeon]